MKKLILDNGFEITLKKILPCFYGEIAVVQVEKTEDSDSLQEKNYAIVKKGLYKFIKINGQEINLFDFQVKVNVLI